MAVLGFLQMLQRSFWREVSAVLWTFLFPVFLLVSLGSIFSQLPEGFARVAVENRDSGAVGAQIEAQIQDTGWHHPNSAGADAQVKIPAETTHRLNASGRARVGVDYVTADSQKRYAIHGLLSAIVLGVNQGRPGGVALSLEAPPPRGDATEPSDDYAGFLVYGLVGLNVLSTALFGVGVGSAWFREQGVLARLWLTPADPWAYLAAHLVHIAILLSASTAFLMGVGALVFDVPAPRFATFGVAMCAGTFALIPVGFAIAARTPTPRVTQMWANTLYFPLMLLSGVYFRPELVADELNGWMFWFPLKPFLDALRGASRGASLDELYTELGVLMLWGVAACLVARGVFRWND